MMAKAVRYLKYTMILHMFSAGYQSCISQLNSLTVLPNSCRLLFTTANIHAEGSSTGINDGTDSKGVTPSNGVTSFCRHQAEMNSDISF